MGLRGCLRPLPLRWRMSIFPLTVYSLLIDAAQKSYSISLQRTAHSYILALGLDTLSQHLPMAMSVKRPVRLQVDVNDLRPSSPKQTENASNP